MEITIKRLTECTLEEIVTAWNKGFEGYFVKIEMTAETLMGRIISEGLSLSQSIVAVVDEKPVGIVLNGFRMVNGKKVSWNGGTGVAVEYRGKGISNRLMEEILKIYLEEGVETATLEAIKANEKAIRLYEKYGYSVVGEVGFLSGTPELFDVRGSNIVSKVIRPEQFEGVSFYNPSIPWQCQWQSVKSGEAQIFSDSEGNPLGYALYRKVWNTEGKLEKVFLYQFELLREVNEEIVRTILTLLAERENHSVNFITINLPYANPVSTILLQLGFTKTTEQVQMTSRVTGTTHNLGDKL
ncbi:MAG: GNAT family N-acetyltransferase [Bacillota bacterium]|nr:GNAT family N-acetyltransferase [Bacillota bacterium]